MSSNVITRVFCRLFVHNEHFRRDCNMIGIKVRDTDHQSLVVNKSVSKF